MTATTTAALPAATCGGPRSSVYARDIEAGRVDCVVVYKVDRLSRSLLDFARIMELFDSHQVSFVSVTQQFNTTSSMGRLTLNILLSFAQFEREIISERTKDKMAAARRKGKWVGGQPVLGYDIDSKRARLVVNSDEASQVRAITLWICSPTWIRASGGSKHTSGSPPRKPGRSEPSWIASAARNPRPSASTPSSSRRTSPTAERTPPFRARG